MLRSRAARGLALCVFLCLGAGCAAPEARVRVVLVTLDTLRQDVFDGRGPLAPAMPRLLARAERGTRFLNFYAATSTTQPTHASLFTGLHPWQHGITRNGEVLDAGHTTVAEILQGAGFETAAVIASYPVAASFGFGRGFDRFREEFTTGFRGARAWEGHRLPDGTFYSRAETVTDRALAALDAMQGRRQFLWLHYFDPHAPYGSSQGGELMEADVFRRIDAGEPTETLMEEVRALYREDVEHLDRHLERLLSRLDREADRFETHVVLVSDHGESLGEAQALGHGYGLRAVEIRVPALILSPAFAPGVRHDVAGSVDVAPTLLALARVSHPLPGGRDLRDAAPDAEAVGMRRTFRQARPGERRLDGGIREIPELLFYRVDSEGKLRLGNGRRLGAGRKGPADEALLERFRSFERELGRRAGDGELDPAVEQRLRALGYVP